MEFFKRLLLFLSLVHLILPDSELCAGTPSKIDHACAEVFWKLVKLARVKQAYECPKRKENVVVTDACKTGTCGKLLGQGGEAWRECARSETGYGGLPEDYQDPVECIVEKTLMSCGYGMYGAALAGDKGSHLSCPCQLIEAQIKMLIEKAMGIEECHWWVPKMLCIPNMMSAISICSFPRRGQSFDVEECIMRTMKTQIVHDGVSVPVCYIHLCHALKDLYNIEMPNCECGGKYSKRNFELREWFAFTNQDPVIPEKLHRNPNTCAARDVSMYPMPGMKFLPGQIYTDFADPQACNRFQRCYTNGPCFNGTDGGYCGFDEHFKVNVENPEENACYPRSLVDCREVPLTKDSAGVTPFCFEGNKDFSDIWQQAKQDNNGPITAFYFGVDEDNYVESVRFQFANNWGVLWGAPNVPGKTRGRTVTLGPKEYVKVVSGKTINIDTENQRVVEVTIETLDMDSKSTRSETFGFVPAAVDSTSWSMSYPPGANAYNGCPLKFSCGSLIPGKFIQVLTTHWYECCYSTNEMNNGVAQVNAESVCK